ncbi:SAV_915 family protein [Actinoplanes lobatus]|uniref:SAV_915 family protein n=1 Tax=Actinoplanes lobatus TaxID=113568 RepID=UPI00389964D7
MHHTEDGRLALLVYSSLELLVDCCGTGQPWTQIPVTDLDRIQALTGFELVLIDARIPQQLRRGEDER